MSAKSYAALGYIEHFRRAQDGCAQGSDAWYHFHKMAAAWVREWRETSTLTTVKR